MDFTASTPSTTAVASSRTPCTTATKIQTAHVKRPLNLFQVWEKQEKPKMCKGKGNVNQRGINTVLGQIWKTKVSEEEKQQWKLMAEQEKEKHKQAYQKFQAQENQEAQDKV